MADGVVNGLQPAVSGIDLPTALGQIQSNFAQVAQHIADETVAHGIDEILTDLAAVIAEVVAARGTQNGLVARLSQALNDDGTLKATITQVNGSEWVDPQWAGMGRTDLYTFTIPGNQTSIMVPMRRVCLSDGVTSTYGLVCSSSYNGVSATTVVLYDAVVPATVSSLKYGLITPSPNAAASLDGRVFNQNGWIEYNNIGF